ncbi:MAG TPA: hypothetical protein PK488_00060, partial [Bacillota bacterium]|nr:hypothetical protein [Bacillota bacterium]
RPRARVLVGRYAGMKPNLAGCCYFSLLEAADRPAFEAMLGAAESWASARGLGKLIGPWSPTDGEDDRCFLIDGFDGPPTLMGTYNQRWYPEAMDGLGYLKEMDLCTFLLTGKAEIEPRIARALELALLRSRSEIGHVDIKDMQKDAKDMFEILKACAAEDPLLPDPTWEQFMNEAKQLSKLADERLILVARRKEDRKPVAFVVCMPNWSEVLKKMRGRVFPVGWVHALGAKRRIKGMRALMQFCVPEYRGSGIMAVLYWKIFEEAVKAGYSYGEAGIIKDDNHGSRRPIEAIGGRKYRTYRWYGKQIRTFAGTHDTAR